MNPSPRRTCFAVDDRCQLTVCAQFSHCACTCAIMAVRCWTEIPLQQWTISVAMQERNASKAMPTQK